PLSPLVQDQLFRVRQVQRRQAMEAASRRGSACYLRPCRTHEGKTHRTLPRASGKELARAEGSSHRTACRTRFSSSRARSRQATLFHIDANRLDREFVSDAARNFVECLYRCARELKSSRL